MNAALAAAALAAAISALDEAKSQLAAGTLGPVDYGFARERNIAMALRAMAAAQGITLVEPVQVDSNGEYSVIAAHPEGHVLTHGCGKFGEAFARALTEHKARTGVVATAISPDNGWCRLNHFEAEKMVREYHAAAATAA